MIYNLFFQKSGERDELRSKIEIKGNKKLFEEIKIIKSNKSILKFEVQNDGGRGYNEKYTDLGSGLLYPNDYSWKIDFKKMKLELYEYPRRQDNYNPFKNKLSSIDLN